MIQHPRYKHDCNHCRFVGWIDACDGYICIRPLKARKRADPHTLGSVIIRYGDEPGDNGSMPLEMVCDSDINHMGRYREVVELALTLQGKTIPEGKIDASLFEY